MLSGKDFYDYKVSTSFKPESQNEDEGISLQADWQTEYFLVTSISAYRAHDSWDNVDADFYDVDALIPDQRCRPGPVLTGTAYQ